MSQRAVPCLILRAGTSRGPYFRKSDLPADAYGRDQVLLAAMGSPDPRQIDGIGGADPLTSKTAIIAKSDRPGIDVDYLFAQVSIGNNQVDTGPSCGNMLAGVGPAAIELGLIDAADGETRIRIYNENTGSRIEAVVQTPGGQVQYDGGTAIDGVPGTAAPITLNFMDIVGSKTGALLPTGKPIDTINGVEVSCVDVAMPMVLMRASDLGLTGHETRAEIEAIPDLIGRIEPIRRAAGRLMGLGDVRDSVVPKVGLLAASQDHADICSRYFTPLQLHATHAVTGAICVATAGSVPGTIAHEVARPSTEAVRDFTIAHPAGHIPVRLSISGDDENMSVTAGTVRTARLIMRGEIMVPADAFSAQEVCDNSLMSAA